METSLTFETIPPIPSIALAVSSVAPWMPLICLLISSVALAVWVARLLTSAATTAKPLPASPARAASIVAFSASRLVCSAISVISWITVPIFWAESRRPITLTEAPSTSVTASSEIDPAWLTCWLTSRMVVPSSSAAAATDCTLLAVLSDVSLANTDFSEVFEDESDMLRAIVSDFESAVRKEPRIPEIPASKSLFSASILARRASRSLLICSSRRRCSSEAAACRFLSSSS